MGGDGLIKISIPVERGRVSNGAPATHSEIYDLILSSA